MSADPKQIGQLREGNQNGGGRDEAGDDRMRHEIRHEAQPEQAEHQQQGSHHEGQRHCRDDIVFRAE